MAEQLPQGFQLDPAPNELPQGFQLDPQLTPEQQEIVNQSEAKINTLQADIDRLAQVRNNPDLLESVFGGVEGFLALGSGLAAPAVGGIAGLAEAANPFSKGGAGADVAEKVQSALTFEPQLPSGKAAIGDVAETLAPVAEGLKDLREDIGSNTLKATDSPFLASIASILPDATLSLLGVKSLTGAKGLTGQSQASTLAQQQATKEVVNKFSKLQTPAKQKLSELVAQGSRDASTAKVKLSSDGLVSKITDGLPRIVNDPKAIAAIDQGLDQATTAMVKSSSKLEKAKFKEMLNIAEKSLKDRVFRANTRVGEVAGKSLLDRVNAVKKINKRAGSNLDKIASGLKGKTADKSASVEQFVDDLGKLDIKIDGNLRRLNFVDSAIEGGTKGANSAQKILSLTLKRLNKLPENANAFEMHKLKRFIDSQVKFGKDSTGAAGAAEATLKNLRRSIDGALDSKFPQYKKINDVFSETIGALDDFQKAAGGTLKLDGPLADKALGVKLRALTNNTQSRANIMDSMSKLEDAALNNGVRFKDRILEQALFADDLETLLKLAPKTGFKSQIAEGVIDSATGSTAQAAIRTSKTIADKLKGKTPEKAIKAIRELLEDTQ